MLGQHLQKPHALARVPFLGSAAVAWLSSARPDSPRIAVKPVGECPPRTYVQ
jgi:hypothetical protein